MQRGMIPRSMLPTLNSRVLNTLFNAVTNEEFKKLSSINNTKEAWTILQNTYEGTKVVKNSLDEYESFDEFYAKLKNIVNSAFNLGEQILSQRLLGRSLDHFGRDSMPRLLPLKNQRTLTLFL